MFSKTTLRSLTKHKVTWWFLGVYCGYNLDDPQLAALFRDLKHLLAVLRDLTLQVSI